MHGLEVELESDSCLQSCENNRLWFCNVREQLCLSFTVFKNVLVDKTTDL